MCSTYVKAAGRIDAWGGQSRSDGTAWRIGWQNCVDGGNCRSSICPPTAPPDAGELDRWFVEIGTIHIQGLFASTGRLKNSYALPNCRLSDYMAVTRIMADLAHRNRVGQSISDRSEVWDMRPCEDASHAFALTSARHSAGQLGRRRKTHSSSIQMAQDRPVKRDTDRFGSV